MDYAALFLAKVIDEGDYKALQRHNITATDMPSQIDRNIYNFVAQYAEQNEGACPSYAVVAANVEGYEYIPDITDSYEYLAKQAKGQTAKRLFIEKVNEGELQRKLNEMDGISFVEEYLPSVIDSIKIRTSVRQKTGTSVKDDSEKFMAEYARRKQGESFKVWRSKFSAIGEYIGGNLYTVFAESGRGKSAITSEDAIYAAQQGARVLIWALEMGWYEIMARIYTSLSGDAGVTNAVWQGVEYDAGFSSRAIRLGQLDDAHERAFRDFIADLNENIEGELIIRANDDKDFNDRSLRALADEIEETRADYVVIDPFYYLDYERNTARTTGGDAANTSIKLRRLAGSAGVVIVAITQADEGDVTFDDEDEVRELAVPQRKRVKKTKQLLEDAAILIGVDTDYKQGLGLVGVLKGRDGGEGNVSNIIYLPQFGVIKEMETGADAVAEFNF